MSGGGYVLLHRSAMDSWLWSLPGDQLKVALTCLLRANWKPGETFSGGARVAIPRGALMTSLDKLAAHAGVSVRTARTALANLERAGFLASKATNRFRLISIVNYDRYQLTGDESDKQTDKQNGRQPTGQPTSGSTSKPTSEATGQPTGQSTTIEERKTEKTSSVPAAAGAVSEGAPPSGPARGEVPGAPPAHGQRKQKREKPGVGKAPPLPYPVKDLLAAFKRGAGDRFRDAVYDRRLNIPLAAVIRQLEENGLGLADVERAGRRVAAEWSDGFEVDVSWLATTGKLLREVAKAAPAKGAAERELAAARARQDYSRPEFDDDGVVAGGRA